MQPFTSVTTCQTPDLFSPQVGMYAWGKRGRLHIEIEPNYLLQSFRESGDSTY